MFIAHVQFIDPCISMKFCISQKLAFPEKVLSRPDIFLRAYYTKSFHPLIPKNAEWTILCHMSIYYLIGNLSDTATELRHYKTSTTIYGIDKILQEIFQMI